MQNETRRISPPGRLQLQPRSTRVQKHLRMQSAAYAATIHLSTHLADPALLYRNTAALRLLRIMQGWALEHLVEPGRGAIWVARDWLQKRLGVSRAAYYRALTRLRATGWIEDSVVADESGRERPGFRVAFRANDGFREPGETQTRPNCDTDATQLRPRCDFSTLKLSEVKLIEVETEMSRKPRQSSLPGADFEAPKERETGKRMDGKKRRDPRLRPIAERIDEYERARYFEHPRRVRGKRDSPEARSVSVEAITKALERTLDWEYSQVSLESMEVVFRGVIELNWDAAERKVETWDWWSGSNLWAPMSLERCLGWLEEERNAVFLQRAHGDLPLPVRSDMQSGAGDVVDISALSPRQQQEQYDRDHGIESPLPDAPDAGYEIKYLDGVTEDSVRQITGELAVVWGQDPVAGSAEVSGVSLGFDPAAPGGDETGIVELEIAEDGKQSVSKTCKTEYADVFLDGVKIDPFGGVQTIVRVVTRPKTDDELRQESARKLAYLKATTPEERQADADAGRKPWEVG